MKRLTFAVFLLGTGIGIGSGNAQTEPVNEYYPDGQIKKETYEKRGKNYRKEYYPDGQLKYSRTINLKTEKKITRVFYKNGILKSKFRNMPDSKGNNIGIWQFYGTDGKLESEQCLKNGMYISTEHFRDFTSSNQNGAFRIEIHYKKGKWKGRGGNFTRVYDKNGALLNETPLDESLRWP